MAISKPKADIISSPKAEKVKEPEAPSRTINTYVRWIPANEAFSERIITSADWKGLGIDAPDRSWNDRNNRQILEESFSDEELDYLECDGGFEIVDA